MIHEIYQTVINGKEKRVGLLGEAHFYTAEEVPFLQKVFEEYDWRIREGGFTSALVEKIFYLGAIASFPLVIPSTGINYIEEKFVFKKRPYSGVRYMERFEEAKDITLRASTLFPFLSLVGIMDWPVQLVNTFLYGDSTRHDSVNGFELIRNGHTYEIMGQVTNFLADVNRRDRMMSEKVVHRLENGKKSVLLNCGSAHLPGVRRELAKRIPLEKIAVEYPTYIG